MTNEELKKKIAQIIADYFCPQGNEHKKLWGDDRLCYSKMNFAECEWVTECTDALIAAGIGDVKEVKMAATRYEMLYNMQARDMALAERKAYNAKHRAEVAEYRAEVAERALRDRATYCAMEDMDYFSLTQVAIEARAKELYDGWMQQAEKELAEEGKDENI